MKALVHPQSTVEVMPVAHDAVVGESHLRLLVSPLDGDGAVRDSSAQGAVSGTVDSHFENPSSDRHGLSDRTLRSIMSELCAAIKSTLDDERLHAEDCLRRASEMLRETDGATLTAGASGRLKLCLWQIRKVTCYIDSNLERSIRNDDLAALVRLNTSHFARVFRDSVGEPPHEYVMRRRVERAQGLMLSTDASLSEIALNCGLADQSHLTRLFRRHVGDSPAAWRKARLNELPA